MKITLDEVNYIARLSKLRLSEEESTKFLVEFEDILEHFTNIDAIDTEVEADSDITSEPTIFRADESLVFEDKTSLFANVKTKRDTYIQVPKIIE